jgi:hypothetical protein
MYQTIMNISFLTQNVSFVRSRHYMQNATAANHWYAFSRDKVKKLQAKLGNGFCLIINGSVMFNEAYIIPYDEFAKFYTDDYLDVVRGRWVGTIKNNQIKITAHGLPTKIISGGPFYNAFELLDTNENLSNAGISDQIVATKSSEPTQEDLQKIIAEFNDLFANVHPTKKITVSEKVSRPNAITDYLKQLHNYKCQLCGILGFKQQNGSFFAEAHHVIELHKLIPGSYCSDNIIVVCANCHRKLHYASVIYESIDHKKVAVTINGQSIWFVRNIISKKMPHNSSQILS